MSLSRSVFLAIFCALAPSLASAADAPACGSPARACNSDFMTAVAKIGESDAALADDFRKLYSELIAYSPDSIQFEKDIPDVPATALADYNRRLHALDGRGVADGSFGKLDANGGLEFGTPLYTADYYTGFAIYALAHKAVPDHFKKITAELVALESRTSALETDVKAAGSAASPEAKTPLEARLAQLNVDGTEVWNRFHADALNEADSSSRISAGLQPLMNPLQTRIAELSKRLQAVDRALNGDARRAAATDAPKMTDALRARLNPDLSNLNPFGSDKAAPSGGAAPGAVRGTTSPKAGSALAAVGAKTLLDLSQVPAPGANPAAGPAGPQPPVSAGAAGEDASPEATKAVNALRKAGKTQTIGDVSGRAAFAFHQTGNTCTIASQVEILADLGEVKADPQALKAKEDELYARSVSLGYFNGNAADPQSRENGGTSWMHAGELLDRPIQRQFMVKPADLQKTVSTGRMVMVETDAGVLWHQRQYAGSKHTVVITGAEVERGTGRLLGYYINDTGVGEGGRFVDAAQFLKAWDGALVVP